MSNSRPVTVLCLASYFKGGEFIRECKRLGCRVILLTVEKLRDAAWPRESIDELFFMPDLHRRDDVIHGVSYLARSEEIDPILNYDRIREYLATVPPPWVLKPRLSASAIGIKRLDDAEQVWRVLDELGDRQSFHLLERFIRGRVLHVDSIVWEREVVFAEAHGYLNPPFEVYHGGGVFCTHTLGRFSPEARALKDL